MYKSILFWNYTRNRRISKRSIQKECKAYNGLLENFGWTTEKSWKLRKKNKTRWKSFIWILFQCDDAYHTNQQHNFFFFCNYILLMEFHLRNHYPLNKFTQKATSQTNWDEFVCVWLPFLYLFGWDCFIISSCYAISYSTLSYSLFFLYIWRCGAPIMPFKRAI